MKLSTLLTLLLSIVSMDAALNDVPHLTLSASAVLKKPADELQMKIGVVTLNVTAKDALEENTLKIRSIIDQLESIGLDSSDYETSQFSINPTYTPYPQNPPINWKPSINGYEVTNSLLIHTDKLDLIGKVIDCSSYAGATSMTDIRFGLRYPREYWAEALAAAGANAIQDAKVIAEATGIKLIRVLSISLSQMNIRSPQIHLASFAKGALLDGSTPIEAGDISIEATVNLVYEIN